MSGDPTRLECYPPRMHPDGLRALLAVLETGSLQAASQQLDWPRATVTRRIDELEASTGAVLLLRTRRGAQLSELGLEVARRGEHILREMDRLLSTARGGRAEPSGPVRVRMPIGPPMSVASLILKVAAERFPKVRFSVTPAADPLDGPLVNADVVLHFGPGRPPSDWITLEIARPHEGLLASKEYAARRGLPETPEQLAAHPLVVWAAPGGAPRELVARTGQRVAIDPILVSPDIELVRRLTLAGAGIGWAPTAPVPLPDEPSHALLPVLPEVFDTERVLYFSMPRELTEVTRFRAILEAVRAALGGEAPGQLR
jgi:DNA-binding transcriptional LysR family regulator